METLTGCCHLVDPGMDDDDAAQVALRFKALADPGRVRILNLLVRNPELCVCELQEVLELAQPTVSHHLSVLKKAGLVQSEMRGRWAFYRADTDAINALRDVLEVTP